jgi:hypothetical protein
VAAVSDIPPKKINANADFFWNMREGKKRKPEKSPEQGDRGVTQNDRDRNVKMMIRNGSTTLSPHFPRLPGMKLAIKKKNPITKG